MGLSVFTKFREPGPRLSGLGTPWVVHLDPVSAQGVSKAAKLAGGVVKAGALLRCWRQRPSPVVLFPWTEPPCAGGGGCVLACRASGGESTRVPSSAVVGLWLT